MVSRWVSHGEPNKICPRYCIASDICCKCHDLSVLVQIGTGILCFPIRWNNWKQYIMCILMEPNKRSNIQYLFIPGFYMFYF
jgi:hypothetical protein